MLFLKEKASLSKNISLTKTLSQKPKENNPIVSQQHLFLTMIFSKQPFFQNQSQFLLTLSKIFSHS